MASSLWIHARGLRACGTVVPALGQRVRSQGRAPAWLARSGAFRALGTSPVDPPVDVGPVDPDDPTGDKAVYRGILSTQIKLVKGFSLTTSLIGLSCQPVLYHYIQQQGGASVGVVIVTGAFLSFFTFATPLLIHFISKKYVTELRYNRLEDSYTAITYSLLLTKKEIKFRLQDVHVPDIPGMFTTFKARNVPLFVDGSQFDVPQHYGKIMGYDKPLNLRWDGDEGRKSHDNQKPIDSEGGNKMS
eukprot:maker-scaffold1404_size42976-snap-gene-0.11 protein:Tk06749 transcript:maker-scaffold1404_size42976-snap-gene-0.11-mRNA-1 annotation:"GK24268"